MVSGNVTRLSSKLQKKLETTSSVITIAFATSMSICFPVSAVPLKYHQLGSIHTLQEAFSRAYQVNPQILKEQAVLRQTDEGIAQARAGWRPTISVSTAANYSQSNYVTYPYGGSYRYDQHFSAPGYNVGLTVTQPIFSGGSTLGKERKSRNRVKEEQANLAQTEQQVLLAVVNAYVGVIQARKILSLAHSNEVALANQADISARQLRLNQGTRTDVEQSASQYQAARAASRQAEGDLAVARNTFLSVLGMEAPDNLALPPPLALSLRDEADAKNLASNNNPIVKRSFYALAAARDSVRVEFATLLPQVSAELNVQHQANQSNSKFTQDGMQAVIQATIPLYQGGGEYAALRAARVAVEAAQHDLDEQRWEAIRQAGTSWQKLKADQDQERSNRAATVLAQAALASMQDQEKLGMRTMFEVLQQRQILFQQQKDLVQNTADIVRESYSLAASVGKLEVGDLKQEGKEDAGESQKK